MPRGVVALGEWQEDASAVACRACSDPFTLVTRRHHCRGCGLIFCAKCTLQATLGQYGASVALPPPGAWLFWASWWSISVF